MLLLNKLKIKSEKLKNMPTVKHENIIFFPEEFKTNKEVGNDNVVSMEEFKEKKKRRIKKKEETNKNDLFKEESTLKEIKIQLREIIQEANDVFNILAKNKKITDKNEKNLLTERLTASIKKVITTIDFCENKEGLGEELKKLKEIRENIRDAWVKSINITHAG